MNVKNLINKLNELDPNAEVIIQSSNFEHRGADVSLSYVYQYNTGSKKTQIFRDAFDGDTYPVETWSTVNGNLPVVYLS